MIPSPCDSNTGLMKVWAPLFNLICFKTVRAALCLHDARESCPGMSSTVSLPWFLNDHIAHEDPQGEGVQATLTILEQPSPSGHFQSVRAFNCLPDFYEKDGLNESEGRGGPWGGKVVHAGAN